MPSVRIPPARSAPRVNIRARVGIGDSISTTFAGLPRAGYGLAGETVIMKVAGWRTRNIFKRYAIVNNEDIADAMQKLQDFQK